MVDEKPKSRDYLHAFTLYQSAKIGKVTSSKARQAYTDTLEAKGFRREALDRSGVLRRLPEATMVGNFPSPASAIAAVVAAEAAGEAADPGKFFRESSVLTTYRRVRLIGPEVTAPVAPVASPKPATKPTRSVDLLAKVRENQKAKRE